MTKSPHASRQPAAPVSYSQMQQRRDAIDAMAALPDAADPQPAAASPGNEIPFQPETSPWRHDVVGLEPPIDGTLCSDQLGLSLGGSSPPKADAEDSKDKTR